MRVKKFQNARELTIETMQTCISMLQALHPKFEALLQSDEIDQAELESLTNRFKDTMIDLYGPNTQPSERYEDWHAFFWSSWNQSDSQQKRDRQIQDDYRSGLERTLTELDSVLEQLQLKLQHVGVTKMTSSAEIQLVLRLCGRLNHSAKILNNRRAGKQPFEVHDEYDVQELLQAVLRAYFKYSVSEDPIGKLAGVSSRADFAIKELGIIIEVKFVHGPNEQDRITKQFAEDCQSYSQCQFLEHFIYLVYGAEDLRDPELLDQLDGLKELNGKRFKAHIVRCPK